MKSFAELDAKICNCTQAFNAKLEGADGKRAILLCGGYIPFDIYIIHDIPIIS